MISRAAGTGLHNWRRSPYNRWAFQHVRELIPTARIARSTQEASALAGTASEPGILYGQAADGASDLSALLEASHTDAFIALNHGKVVMQWRAGHMDVRQPHILFSVSKSLTGILAGILTDHGLFDPEAAVTDYLPQARSGVYGACSMRHVLDMTVEMDFEENYTDLDSDYVEYRKATGWNPVDQRNPGPDLEEFLMSIRPGDEPHGTAFRYRSPNSDLLGLAVERAAGEPLAYLFSKYLWQPLGAGDDAYITVDHSGLARGAGGICVTIDDLARVGKMMLAGGRAGGRQVVSSAWVEDTSRNGDRAAWRHGDFAALFPDGQYRNQWYQVGDADGSICAMGIHGQYLYINPRRAVVIAKLSSLPDPVDEAMDTALLAAFARVAEYLG